MMHDGRSFGDSIHQMSVHVWYSIFYILVGLASPCSGGKYAGGGRRDGWVIVSVGMCIEYPCSSVLLSSITRCLSSCTRW